MANEGTKILILVRALFEPITPSVMTGHDGHVLQMTVTALFTDRAVVRMVGHQPLDDAGAKGFRLLVIDRDIGVVLDRCHTGHDQHAALVVGILVLLDRALAAGAHAAQRRMPAEIGNVEAQRQAGVQQIVTAVDLVVLAVYMNGCHEACLLPVTARRSPGTLIVISRVVPCSTTTPSLPVSARHAPHAVHDGCRPQTRV